MAEEIKTIAQEAVQDQKHTSIFEAGLRDLDDLITGLLNK